MEKLFPNENWNDDFLSLIRAGNIRKLLTWQQQVYNSLKITRYRRFQLAGTLIICLNDSWNKEKLCVIV